MPCFMDLFHFNHWLIMKYVLQAEKGATIKAEPDGCPC